MLIYVYMVEKSKKLFEKLVTLIDRGIALTHKTHYKRAMQQGEEDIALNIYSEYVSWISECAPLLNQNGFIDEAEKFLEGSNVELLPYKSSWSNGKLTYESPLSKFNATETEKLLSDIRTEVKEKLQILRNVRISIKELFTDKKPEGNKQRTMPQNVRAIFQIEYTTNRVIVVNKKYKLSQPNLNSAPDKFFSYLIKHPNELIKKTDFEIDRQNWKIPQITYDLGFKDILRPLFLPGISKNSVMLQNPITTKQLKDSHISKKEIMEKLTTLPLFRNDKK